MPKIEDEKYQAAKSNDNDLIGVKITVERGSRSVSQQYVIDDCCEDLGRVIGTTISMLASLRAVSESGNQERVLTDESIDKIKTLWREVIRG